MSKTAQLILIIILYSVIAFGGMYYLIGFAFKKAIIISGSAGLAMIVFDLFLVRKRAAP